MKNLFLKQKIKKNSMRNYINKYAHTTMRTHTQIIFNLEKKFDKNKQIFYMINKT